MIPAYAQCPLCAGLAQAERDRAKFGAHNLMHIHRTRRGRRPKSDPLPQSSEIKDAMRDDDAVSDVDPLLDTEFDRAILSRARFE